MTWEFAILDWIQTSLRSEWLDGLAQLLSRPFDGGAAWIALCLVLLAVKKTRPLGAALSAALLLEWALCNGVCKPLFDRARPCDLRPAVELLVERPWGASFPSGHTGAAFAAAGAMYARRVRLWPLWVLLAGAVGLSRLYLYVHFPTDVAAGVLLGWCCGLAGSWLADWWQKRRGAGSAAES